MIVTGAPLLQSILDPRHSLALAAAMRLRHYVVTQFGPASERSVAAADALYRAALFAIRERDAEVMR